MAEVSFPGVVVAPIEDLAVAERVDVAFLLASDCWLALSGLGLLTRQLLQTRDSKQ